MPRITRPFVVVTGSSDVGAPLPYAEGGLARTLSFLENPLLRGYFAQNPKCARACARACGGRPALVAHSRLLLPPRASYKHAKMVPLHIGLDFHTISQPRLTEHSWGAPMSAPAQDAELMTLRCALPAFSARPPLALLNFKTAGRGIRSQVAALLGGRAGVVTIDNLPRSQLWARYGEFAFVLSPRGYGLDCHRTWEALSLGSAVIATSDAFLHELYEDLPVIQIANWADVTAENLQRWHAEISARWWSYNFAKLRQDYWLSAVERVRAQGSLEGIYGFSTNKFNFSAGRLLWGKGAEPPPPESTFK